MSQSLLLPIVGALAASVVVALILVLLFVKRERASGEGIVKRARNEAEALVANAVRDGVAARLAAMADDLARLLPPPKRGSRATGGVPSAE